ncbi:unnamed protein product, partial [Prorocentrum cordatum]
PRRRCRQLAGGGAAAQGVEGLCHVVMQLHGRLRAEARRAEELEAQRLLLLGRLEGAARAAHGARGPEGPPTQYELFVLERPALLDMRHLAALEAAAHAAEERRREELFWQWMADVLRAAEPAPGPAGAAAGARGSLPGGCDTEIDGAGLQESSRSRWGRCSVLSRPASLAATPIGAGCRTISTRRPAARTRASRTWTTSWPSSGGTGRAASSACPQRPSGP